MAAAKHDTIGKGMTLEDKRILIFLRSLEMGGAQRQALMLAEYLQKKQGAAVRIMTFSLAGMAAPLFQEKGLQLEKAPGMERGRLHKAFNLVRLILRMRSFRPDIILPYCDFPNKVCGSIWQLTGARACIWNQRDEGREITGKFLERRALKRTPCFVANSLDGKNFLTSVFKIPQEKIHLIHNGVWLPPSELDRRQWREKLHIGSEAMVAVMLANLTRFKDHMTLLRAWRLVMERCGSGKPVLLLAGKSGETEDTLRSSAAEWNLADRVHFLGQVKDTSGLLHAADIGILSSKNEGLPNAILEYMAAGLAVVSTRISGSCEALGEEYPYLVEADNAEQLADRVLLLQSEPEVRRRLGQQNRLRAECEFTPERMGREYSSLFLNLLSGDAGEAGN